MINLDQVNDDDDVVAASNSCDLLETDFAPNVM